MHAVRTLSSSLSLMGDAVAEDVQSRSLAAVAAGEAWVELPMAMPMQYRDWDSSDGAKRSRCCREASG